MYVVDVLHDPCPTDRFHKLRLLSRPFPVQRIRGTSYRKPHPSVHGLFAWKVTSRVRGTPSPLPPRPHSRAHGVTPLVLQLRVPSFRNRPPLTISLDEVERLIVHCNVEGEWEDLPQQTGAEGGRPSIIYHVNDRPCRGAGGRFPTWLRFGLVCEASTEDAIPDSKHFDDLRLGVIRDTV